MTSSKLRLDDGLDAEAIAFLERRIADRRTVLPPGAVTSNQDARS
jgi:hypothetical protein